MKADTQANRRPGQAHVGNTVAGDPQGEEEGVVSPGGVGRSMKEKVPFLSSLSSGVLFFKNVYYSNIHEKCFSAKITCYLPKA